MCCFCLCQAAKGSTAYYSCRVCSYLYSRILSCVAANLILHLLLYLVFFSLHLHLEGSQRISDSEISDYDCEDGVGVITGNVLGGKNTQETAHPVAPLNFVPRSNNTRFLFRMKIHQ